MFTVISVMLGGILAGYLLRRKRLAFVQKAITPLIWLLLFLLGNEAGNNKQIMQGLHTLGVEALLITLAAVAGSILAAWGLWQAIRHTHKRKSA